MSYGMQYEPYQGAYPVAQAPADTRAAFIRKTYGHLAGAMLAFVAIEAALFSSGVAFPLVAKLFSIPYSMLILMVAFIGGGYAAQAMAQSATSKLAQYAGLGLYVLLEVVIFLPLLVLAELKFPGQYMALQAGVVTLAAFAGLTLVVATTGKDFSFLRPILMIGSFVALGVIVCAILFGASNLIGSVFSGFMILLAAGYVLYSTSNVMHHYREDQYVAAALQLFAAVALMFYYILRLFMSSSSSD